MKFRHLPTLALASLLTVAGCASEAPAPTAPAQPTSTAAAAAPTPTQAKPTLEMATAIARRTLIVDGHVDLPYRLHNQKTEHGKILDDVGTELKDGNFDYVRGKAGGLDAPFMSIYIPAKHQKEGGAKALADELIDMVEAIQTAHPDKFQVAKSVADVEAAFAAGRIALPLGIENGAAIEKSLDNLRHFAERGVRYITLTHSEDNAICDSSYSESHTHKGLSAFGREVVAEMNHLGIMIDVSHISDDTFWHVMKLSKTPVIASHSSCRHFTPGFERNMADDMVAAMKDNGGVVMINYGSSFIDEPARAARTAMWKARKAFMESSKLKRTDPKVEAWNEQYKSSHELPFATVEQVADHIDHVVKVAGIDHVGLGSDFDGVGDSLPSGLKSAADLPKLVLVLLERGYTEQMIAKIGSGNVMRVWRAVEAHAAASKPSAAN
jgi:membrane dipeptidase